MLFLSQVLKRYEILKLKFKKMLETKIFNVLFLSLSTLLSVHCQEVLNYLKGWSLESVCALGKLNGGPGVTDYDSLQN